jgi:hypothetical protein
MGPVKSQRRDYGRNTDPLGSPNYPTVLDALPTEILLKIFDILAEDESGRRAVSVLPNAFFLLSASVGMGLDKWGK